MIDPFRAKYITFDLKKYTGIIFHDAEDLCKIWRKTDLWFGTWHEELDEFKPHHSRKSKNWDFYWILLSKVENVWAENLSGVTCHDNKEWCKIWRGTELSVQR